MSIAVEYLGHVNVVASRAPAPVLARFGLDSNGLSGTDGFTELTSNASLFPCVLGKGV